MEKKLLQVINLGYRDYQETYKIQKDLLNQRITGFIPDTLILVEHPSVFTIGRRGGREHLLVSRELLKEKGILVYEVDRGGDITYHGPGQIVGYPILDIREHGRDVHKVFHLYAEVLLRIVKEYQVNVHRDPRFPGVWVGKEKIAAIGIGVRHWITYHGFALNVNPDLSYFQMIVPCGINGKGVTSLAQILGREITIQDVIPIMIRHFASVFNFALFTSRKEDRAEEKNNERVVSPLA